MLGFIRHHRNFFMGFFILCGIALILSLALPGGSGQSGSSSVTSSSVAKVGDQEVTVRELQEDIARREEQFRKIFGAQANSEQGKEFFKQIRKNQLSPDKVLEEILQRKILFHLFAEQGLEVSQAAIKSEIEKSPYFQNQGVFDPKLYKEKVAFPAEFEGYLRDQLKSERVLNPFAFVGSLVSEAEIEFEKKIGQKRDFEVLLIPSESYKQPVSVSVDEINNLVADSKKTSELQSFYNRNIKNYKRPEEISARHILVPEEGGEAKIKEIEALILSKKITFADAAKKYSTDKSNASKGGELPFFGKGMMDKSFETAAFELKNKGDISKPVKSAFGYHLIQLTDRKAALETSFNDAKKDIAKSYLEAQKKNEALKTIASKWLVSAKGPDASQLKSMSLSWKKAADWSASQQKLAALADSDLKTTELLSLTKEAPLLKRVLQNGPDLALVRFVSQKESPVKIEEVSYQKSVRMMDLYFDKYKKNLELRKKIQKNDVLLAKLKQAMDL